MNIENKIEFASELADKMLRDLHDDIQIDDDITDVYYYIEEAQELFDRYYDIILNFIGENES